MELRVIGMSEGRRIPDKFTCGGKDYSPKIEIHDRNEDGYYFIVMNDPDAPSGLFTHWLIYNIPAGIVTLEENMGNKEITDDGYYQGINDFGELGYRGPCPPRGDGDHRYFIKIYRMKEAVSRKKIDAENSYKILDKMTPEAEFYAIYSRE
jgi:Raf kinase inhibitor-like YbhB/YbcL family protein